MIDEQSSSSEQDYASDHSAIGADTFMRDRFIDGQAECGLQRHLNSFGPNTPMQKIVDSCRVWESHNEAAVRRHDGSARDSPWAVCWVTED